MRAALLQASFLVGLVASAPAVATGVDPRLEDMAEIHLAKSPGVGIVIATLQDGAERVEGFGTVSQAVARAPNADTIFEIGSVTKTFTALLLADAVAQGEVTLDDPVGKLLPGFAIPAYAGRRITLLDLATQSSGLPRLPANLEPRNPSDPYADYTESDLKSFLAGYTLPRRPGATYEYSNLGFGLLGLALARAQGTTYDALVAARITRPLGMSSSGIAVPALQHERLAPGHDAASIEVPNWDLGILAGAGGLHSTAHDLLIYLRALLAGRAADGAPRGLHTVWQPRRDGLGPGVQVGLAWNIQTQRGQTIVWHNGMTGGYASFVGFAPDSRRAVVVLTNQSVPVDDIGLAALAPGLPTDPATRSSAVPLASDVQAGYAGRYQLAPGFILSISASERGLIAQATGQAPVLLHPRAPDEFDFEIVEASVRFHRDTAGKVDGLTLHQNGRDLQAARLADGPTEGSLPTEIALPLAQLNEYVGTYTVAPGFQLVISEDGGQLFAKATGQGRYPMFASAPDEFFLKVVAARLSFQRDATGAVSGLVLHQNGRDVPAPRSAH